MSSTHFYDALPDRLVIEHVLELLLLHSGHPPPPHWLARHLPVYPAGRGTWSAARTAASESVQCKMKWGVQDVPGIGGGLCSCRLIAGAGGALC